VTNNLIIAIEERLVRYLSQTLAGRVHDKRMGEEEDSTFPPGCVLLKDTGFQGFEPENVCPYHPKKTPSNHERSAAENVENQMMSSIRILVEPVLAGVKRCRMVHDVLRHTKAHFDDRVMEIACGLHNFRTRLRYNMLE
jgi:hypothetical protein